MDRHADRYADRNAKADANRHVAQSEADRRAVSDPNPDSDREVVGADRTVLLILPGFIRLRLSSFRCVPPTVPRLLGRPEDRNAARASPRARSPRANFTQEVEVRLVRRRSAIGPRRFDL